jgi:hypothetical protein
VGRMELVVVDHAEAASGLDREDRDEGAGLGHAIHLCAVVPTPPPNRVVPPLFDAPVRPILGYMHPTLEARNWRLVSWRTAIALVVVGAVFVFGIGNIGGKNGNPSWLIGPLCILLLVALGITALVRSRRNKHVP